MPAPIGSINDPPGHMSVIGPRGQLLCPPGHAAQSSATAARWA